MMAALGESTLRTYRYLRLTVVGLALLLGISLILQIVGPAGALLDSISAYYYTPVRSIFVGALIGIGAALIAITGRPGAENSMLNAVGMLAPLVALVPTPVAGSCGICIPAEFVPGVQNNVAALLIVGVFGLAAAGVTVWPAGWSARLGLGLAILLWAAVVLWFLLWRNSFLSLAHYVCGIGLFLLMAAVAWINARRAPEHVAPPVFSGRTFGRIYRVVAAVMAVAVVVAVVLLVLQRADTGLHGPWLFVVEAVLIVAFAVFWLGQTVQYWRDGIPEGA